MADFHTKYRDTNLQITLETCGRILYLANFYEPDTSGTSSQTDTKNHENALESYGKASLDFGGRNNLTEFFSDFYHLIKGVFDHKNTLKPLQLKQGPLYHTLFLPGRRYIPAKLKLNLDSLVQEAYVSQTSPKRLKSTVKTANYPHQLALKPYSPKQSERHRSKRSRPL